jgi:hypothetical protein
MVDAVELSKCSYHIEFWKFTMQGALVLSNVLNEGVPNILQVTNSSTGIPQELQYLAIHCT